MKNLNKSPVVMPKVLQLEISKDRNVVVRLKELEPRAGLAPGTGLMIRLTPTEARQLAIALNNIADKAEQGLPRV